MFSVPAAGGGRTTAVDTVGVVEVGEGGVRDGGTGEEPERHFLTLREQEVSDVD